MSLQQEVFDRLIRIYVQQSDARQQRMGLQYTTAETHDLARTVARIIDERKSEAESRVGVLEIQIARLKQECEAAQEDAWKYRSLSH